MYLKPITYIVLIYPKAGWIYLEILVPFLKILEKKYFSCSLKYYILFFKKIIYLKKVVESSDVIFIAVKPQFVPKVLIELQPSFTEKHIIVSIAAGITLETLLKNAGNNIKMVRVMPNTPCLVGETASALCYGGKATEEDASIIINLMSAVGMVVSVDEKLMSAVTGLSGSGPAYIFIIIEALADGGVRAGIH